jgi:putative membrane protein
MQWWNAASDSSVSWLMFLPRMVWPILVIGGIVALMLVLSRSSGRTEPPAWRRDTSRQTSIDILRERFARGEIDRQEYEDRKGLLSQP